jgi:autoinducer 2-degrading protein
MLYEVFADEAAYQAHRELAHYAEFRVMTDPWIRSRRVLTYELVTGSGSA